MCLFLNGWAQLMNKWMESFYTYSEKTLPKGIRRVGFVTSEVHKFRILVRVLYLIDNSCMMRFLHMLSFLLPCSDTLVPKNFR